MHVPDAFVMGTFSRVGWCFLLLRGVYMCVCIYIYIYIDTQCVNSASQSGL